MADDSQGFDWAGLVKSATPYAAAMIPAVIGALAGGNKGGGAIGAAAGFTSGMQGEVRAQDQYQQEAARVQEANQRAAMEQQKMAADQQQKQQEMVLRAQRYAQQDRHLDQQNELLGMQVKQIQAKIDDYKTNDQKQQDFRDQNLPGAQRAAFDALDRKGKDKYIEDWGKEQQQNAARPGLIQAAQLFGISPQAAGAMKFDDLSKLVQRGYTEREKAANRPDSFTPTTEHYQDENGNPVAVAYDKRTNTLVPINTKGLTPVGKPGKPPSPQAVQAFMDKEFRAQNGVTNAAQLAALPAGTRENWDMGPFADLALKAGTGEMSMKDYTAAKKKAFLPGADLLAEHRAQIDYMSRKPGEPGPSGEPASEGPTLAGFQKYLQTDKGKEFLAGHKANVLNYLGASPEEAKAATQITRPQPTAKPTFAALPDAKDWAAKNPNQYMRDTGTNEAWKPVNGKWAKGEIVNGKWTPLKGK
jgi:hypothetical protein